ncbi:MAG: hypothetical protein JST11_08110 [Acidobacteria bacterium]|nr:hypothetical protein [Acidobacteriota bacterium]
MKRVFCGGALAAALCAGAWAQGVSGYVFGAPGGLTGSARTVATLQAGAGVELALPKGFGAGVEVGAVSAVNSWGDSTVGVFAPGGTYHFRRGRDRRFDPYAAAGYTMFFRDGRANLFHYGGGVNYWVLRHVGARLEVRDQVGTIDGTVHYWGFRFGVTVR